MTAEPLFLSLEEVLDLHADQLRLFGGADGIRDRGGLEAAVAMPAATFGGSFLHSGVFEMAAAYAFHIAENQPFIDGNKRAALNAALVFLYLNGWNVVDPDMALYDGMLGFATHSLDKHGFAQLLERLAVPVEEDGSAPERSTRIALAAVELALAAEAPHRWAGEQLGLDLLRPVLNFEARHANRVL